MCLLQGGTSMTRVTDKPDRMKGEISFEDREADARREQAELDFERKNFNFLQLQKDRMKDIRALTKRSPTATQLLFLFAEKMNKQNAIVISFQTLELITGYSRPTLSRAVKMLQEERWIQIVKIGTANCYVINSGVFWQDYRDKKITVFNATIIASESEQPKENWKNVTLKKLPVAMCSSTPSIEKE